MHRNILHNIALFLQVQHLGFPGGSDSKECACNAGVLVSVPGSGSSSGEANGNPLQCSRRGISWTEESGKLQSMGLQRVRHD